MATDPVLQQALAANTARRKAEELGTLDRYVGNNLRRFLPKFLGGSPTDAESRYDEARQSQMAPGGDFNAPEFDKIRQGVENERRYNPLEGGANNYIDPALTRPPLPTEPAGPPSAQIQGGLVGSQSAPEAPPLPPTPAPSPSLAPPPSISARYKTASGEWKNVRPGASSPDPGLTASASAGSGANAGTASYKRLDDPGANVSAPINDSIPIGQRPASWFEDQKKIADQKALEAAIGQNEAGLVKSRALQKNPWAEREAETGYRIAQERAASGGRIGENRARLQDTADIQGNQNIKERLELGQRWDALKAEANSAIANAHARLRDPVQLKKALEDIDAGYKADVTELKTIFGVSEKINSQELYKSVQ